MSVLVKICGLARQEDVLATAALEPDAMGFVFYAKSPRAVTAAQVAEWTAGIPSGILKVGVFVNQNPAELQSIMDEAGLDVAQFHGAYSAEDMAQIQALHWRVVQDSVVPAPELLKVSDALLLDSGTADAPGGTGQVGDWNAAQKFLKKVSHPVWLAGGLNPKNVVQAIHQVRPQGVDVSSGVEARPGAKDMTKVAAFIARSRNA
jgi:phosphoribosylanthranilate isomerase